MRGYVQFSVFLTSLSGGIVFRIRFCNLYPGAAPFCFPFSLLSGRPRTGSATAFLFSRWIIDHKVEARSVNVMNTHTHTSAIKKRERNSRTDLINV